MRNLTSLFTTVVLLCGSHSLAGEGVPTPGTKQDVVDSVFDHVCPARLIGDAWMSLDSSQLTDVALLLQHAEQTLGRERRGISAAQAARLAASAAVHSNDQESLQRLANAAKRDQNTELAELVESSLSLAGASRDVEPGMTIFVDEVDPLEYRLLHRAQRAIRRTQIVGDPGRVDSLMEEFASLKQISPERRKALNILLSNSRAAMPAKPVVSDETVRSLSLLAAISRPTTTLRTPGGAELDIDTDVLQESESDISAGSSIANDVTGGY